MIASPVLTDPLALQVAQAPTTVRSAIQRLLGPSGPPLGMHISSPDRAMQVLWPLLHGQGPGVAAGVLNRHEVLVCEPELVVRGPHNDDGIKAVLRWALTRRLPADGLVVVHGVEGELDHVQTRYRANRLRAACRNVGLACPLLMFASSPTRYALVGE